MWWTMILDALNSNNNSAKARQAQEQQGKYDAGSMVQQKRLERQQARMNAVPQSNVDVNNLINGVFTGKKRQQTGDIYGLAQ